MAPAVGHQQIGYFQAAAQGSEARRFLVFNGAVGSPQKDTAGQTKESEDMELREPSARFLGDGLGPCRLVGGGIGSQDGGAIGDGHTPSVRAYQTRHRVPEEVRAPALPF